MKPTHFQRRIEARVFELAASVVAAGTPRERHQYPNPANVSRALAQATDEQEINYRNNTRGGALIGGAAGAYLGTAPVRAGGRNMARVGLPLPKAAVRGAMARTGILGGALGVIVGHKIGQHRAASGSKARQIARKAIVSMYQP